MDPIPSPRPRFRVIGKFASAYMPADYKKWKEAAADFIKRLGVASPFTGAVRVKALFCVRKPRTSKLRYPKPDIDNYEKSLYDAITDSGVVWADDTQIVENENAKAWTEGDPGIHVTIKSIP